MSEFMPNQDLVLSWEFDNGDPRSARAFITGNNINSGGEQVKLFVFSTHQDMTSYYRFNPKTQRLENAGDIEWTPTSKTARVRFGGLRSVHSDDLTRRSSNSSGYSRSFRAENGVEHQWRQAVGDPRDLECLTVNNRSIAMYTMHDQVLRVTPRGHVILDEIVVTLILHLWRRSMGVDFILP